MYFEFSYFDFDQQGVSTSEGRECLRIREPATNSYDITHVGRWIDRPDGDNEPHFCSTRPSQCLAISMA